MTRPDECVGNGANGMCKTHQYPFYECSMMVWKLRAEIIALKQDSRMWYEEAKKLAHNEWLADAWIGALQEELSRNAVPRAQQRIDQGSQDVSLSRRE